MKDKFLKQASREYGPKRRGAALLALGPIFLIILPFVLIPRFWK